jgi:hypothetical protein
MCTAEPAPRANVLRLSQVCKLLLKQPKNAAIASACGSYAKVAALIPGHGKEEDAYCELSRLFFAFVLILAHCSLSAVCLCIAAVALLPMLIALSPLWLLLAAARQCNSCASSD